MDWDSDGPNVAVGMRFGEPGASAPGVSPEVHWLLTDHAFKMFRLAPSPSPIRTRPAPHSYPMNLFSSAPDAACPRRCPGRNKVSAPSRSAGSCRGWRSCLRCRSRVRAPARGPCCRTTHPAKRRTPRPLVSICDSMSRWLSSVSRTSTSKYATSVGSNSLPNTHPSNPLCARCVCWLFFDPDWLLLDYVQVITSDDSYTLSLLAMAVAFMAHYLPSI